MEAILKKVVASHLKNGQLNLASLVLIAMNSVEVFARDVREIHGAQKLQLMREIIPRVIEHAENEGYCSPEEAVALRHRLETGVDLVIHIAEAIHSAATNPQIIQAMEAVQAACCGGGKKKKFGMSTEGVDDKVARLKQEVRVARRALRRLEYELREAEQCAAQQARQKRILDCEGCFYGSMSQRDHACLQFELEMK